MADRKGEFERLVGSGLAAFREPAVRRLRELLARPLPPEARVLWFVITSSTEGLPVRVVAMDDRAINGAAVKDPGTGRLRGVLSQDLVPGDDDYVPPDVMDEYDADVPVGAYEYAARLIAEFVRTCYAEAGGAAHPLRAYANHHDRGTALNLKTGRWVDKEAIHDGRA